MKESPEKRIIDWLINGRPGLSSKCMAAAYCGLVAEDYPPRDPGDFARCLLLLKAVPEIRDAFPKIASISPVWKELTERWDEIEASYNSECGKDSGGMKTYKLINSIVHQ